MLDLKGVWSSLSTYMIGFVLTHFRPKKLCKFQGNHIQSSCGDVINLNLRLKFAVKIPDMDLLFDFHRKKKTLEIRGIPSAFFHMDK